MNAKLLGLFSGFPARRFPAEIAQILKDALPQCDSLVFISAWPDEHTRNLEDAAGMHAMFAEYDMPFANVAVIDKTTSTADAQHLIQHADCLFLMGGNPTLQRQLIDEKGIAEAIRQYRAVLLGVSAGSINRAVRALDIWESPVPYAGLGVVDITIKSHITLDCDLLPRLQQVSREHALPICAMEDNSAIFIQDGQITHLGQIRYILNGELQPFSPALLCP